MKQQELNKQLINMAETLIENDFQLKFKMHGDSMFPTLKAGDVGLVEKCKPENVRIGDIVIFKQNGKLIAHRLIKITYQDEKLTFIAKGDKNIHKDRPFTTNTLIGKLISYQRKNKIISSESFQMKFRKNIALRCSKFTIPVSNFSLKMQNYSRKIKSELKSLKNNLTLITKGSGKELTTNIIISILQGILPFVVIVCLKLLIDFLTQSTNTNNYVFFHITLLLVITSLAFFANSLLASLKNISFERLSQSITKLIYNKLHAKHITLDLSHYENPEEQDKTHRAVQEASFRPIKIINELLTGIKSIAAASFLIVIFISIKWYLVVLLIIATIPGVLVRLQFVKRRYKLKEEQSTKEREMYYYNRVLTGFPFAKELKLFGYSDFFLSRFSASQDTLFEQKIGLKKSELRLDILTQIFAILLIFIALGYVSFLKLSGAISIGTVVLFFFGFQRGYSVLNDLFRSVTQILEDNTFLNDFILFLNLPAKHNSLSNNELAFTLNNEIKIENVSFGYEASKRDALQSINITIPAGKTVAFVGANGSGKTTLIKLLCGFYEPDSGKILFDGIDSTQIGQQTICKNITAVFQDFALYNISASQNIQLGNIDTNIDPQKVKDAASAAGMSGILEALPNGYNTLLGNQFKGGEELSIGQWQKLAIARAFYRNTPLILMDEPSSALDAESEWQMIENLKKLAKDKTAIIISHRLSTVQWADIIYFFEEGKVMESGTHKELMALKSKYFELFQSSNIKF